jgi:hypothetical protein
VGEPDSAFAPKLDLATLHQRVHRDHDDPTRGRSVRRWGRSSPSKKAKGFPHINTGEEFTGYQKTG